MSLYQIHKMIRQTDRPKDYAGLEELSLRLLKLYFTPFKVARKRGGEGRFNRVAHKRGQKKGSRGAIAPPPKTLFFKSFKVARKLGQKKGSRGAFAPPPKTILEIL